MCDWFWLVRVACPYLFRYIGSWVLVFVFAIDCLYLSFECFDWLRMCCFRFWVVCAFVCLGLVLVWFWDDYGCCLLFSICIWFCSPLGYAVRLYLLVFVLFVLGLLLCFAFGLHTNRFLCEFWVGYLCFVVCFTLLFVGGLLVCFVLFYICFLDWVFTYVFLVGCLVIVYWLLLLVCVFVLILFRRYFDFWVCLYFVNCFEFSVAVCAWWWWLLWVAMCTFLDIYV